jgi:hypothetical protein
MVNYLARIDQLEHSWQSYRAALDAWALAVAAGDTVGMQPLASELARWLDEVGIPRATALRTQIEQEHSKQ